MHDVKAALQNMLGPTFGVGVTNPRDPADGLWPEETPAIARAVDKRQRDFAAGRRAARTAMEEFGLTPTAIPQGEQREPIWPDGLIGSISHCQTCCIAAVAESNHHRSIGIDIEPATPLDTDLNRMICQPSERDWLTTQANPQLAAKTIFSIKEAVYKAQFPLTRDVIGFHAVTTEITGMTFTATINETGQKFAGSFLITQGLILSQSHV
ncbi:MAG: 4'-phosphopantetheinyl transferase superfamily protein [Pseudomonadota bacterium]